MQANARDTRVIFGAQIEPGMTIVVECGRSLCPMLGATHAVKPARGHHFLTVLIRHADNVSVIAVDECGNQQGWQGSSSGPVRILTADATPEKVTHP